METYAAKGPRPRAYQNGAEKGCPNCKYYEKDGCEAPCRSCKYNNGDPPLAPRDRWRPAKDGDI
jgi:hypothetical protein